MENRYFAGAGEGLAQDGVRERGGETLVVQNISISLLCW
jgi:hypothetical protein